MRKFELQLLPVSLVLEDAYASQLSRDLNLNFTAKLTKTRSRKQKEEREKLFEYSRFAGELK